MMIILDLLRPFYNYFVVFILHNSMLNLCYMNVKENSDLNTKRIEC
ncbi:hypothetical protein VAE122_3050133 [Vibrio aestuarianus]|nr:hypothetical protein VAE122_3050133 [Vibrio aestuarianus]